MSHITRKTNHWVSQIGCDIFVLLLRFPGGAFWEDGKGRFHCLVERLPMVSNKVSNGFQQGSFGTKRVPWSSSEQGSNAHDADLMRNAG